MKDLKNKLKQLLTKISLNKKVKPFNFTEYCNKINDLAIELNFGSVIISCKTHYSQNITGRSILPTEIQITVFKYSSIIISETDVDFQKLYNLVIYKMKEYGKEKIVNNNDILL